MMLVEPVAQLLDILGPVQGWLVRALPAPLMQMCSIVLAAAQNSSNATAGSGLPTITLR